MQRVVRETLVGVHDGTRPGEDVDTLLPGELQSFGKPFFAVWPTKAKLECCQNSSCFEAMCFSRCVVSSPRQTGFAPRVKPGSETVRLHPTTTG